MLVKVIHNNDVAEAVLKQYKAVAKADFKTPDYEHYSGVYNVVPDKTLQTFDTSDKYVEQDITVQPIPDEYADVSDTTALAQDVRRGKYFYNAEGVRTFGDLHDYAGDYSIDPSHVVQTLQTQGKFLESNMIVGAIPGNLVNVSDTTALAADVLFGKVFHLANGSEATGNIATYAGSNTFTPSESAQTVQTASKYVETNISIAPIPSEYADVTDTTAVANDVLSGKVFHLANGSAASGNIAIYAGANTFTPSTGTQTIQTASKYVSQDITINPIPSNFADVSGVTAQASDVELGKYFVTAAGLLTAGTLNKLEFESGTWSPTTDAERGSIAFSNAHAKPPAIVIVCDITNSVSPNNTAISNVFVDFEQAVGYPYIATSTITRYGACYEHSRNASGSVVLNSQYCTHSYTDPLDTDATYTRYWATNTAFNPYSGIAGRNWLSTRQYNWIAIWV